MPELAISSWSLHRTLGPTYPGLDLDDAPRVAAYPYGSGSLDLLDLPATVAARGIHLLEICHFHFPRTDLSYLEMLRDRLARAGVTPLTLLIDAGDISASDRKAREGAMALIRRWIDVAAALGARQARVIAGYAQPDDAGAVQRSSAGLAELALYGAERSVRVITENWLALSMHPDTLLAILAGAGRGVGLCADFGNYTGPDKYDALRRILPHAASIHAKADFPDPGRMDTEDFRRCLDLASAAGFAGPYVLIFDSAGEEWPHIEQMVEEVRPYLAMGVGHGS
ncbi:MAG: sugar phosphate isomerase/epimerase family protein [Chloroflexota bacterium]